MELQAKIALAGGGSEKDSRPLDQVFALWTRPNRKMLYLPLALRGMRPYSQCLEWIKAAFLPFNITQIEMWTDLSEHHGDELFEFASIYIGGGNTYSLLAQVLESGFDHHLLDYAAHGGIIYGGSAGAAILGKDIRSVKHIDVNKVGLIETQGLNLAAGHAVWVHYQPHDDELIYAFQANYNQSVLALSERAGIVLEQAEINSVGFDSAYLFDKHGKHRLG